MEKEDRRSRGYVLTGGGSRRMGEDKALLPLGGQPLALRMAGVVRQVCGNVTLVGERQKYASLGCEVVADELSGNGPLGGIHAALAHSDAAWNLIAGCDMPFLTADFLGRLLAIAWEADADAVVPESPPSGYEPLCAVYARRCLPVVEDALRQGQRKVAGVFGRLRLRLVTRPEWQEYDPDGRLFWNLNTPEEYRRAAAELAIPFPGPPPAPLRGRS